MRRTSYKQGIVGVKENKGKVDVKERKQRICSKPVAARFKL